MPANRGVVKLFLFTSSQINLVFFIVEAKRLKLFLLVVEKWFWLLKLFCLIAFLHKMPTEVHRVNLKAFLVAEMTSVCKKSSFLP